MTRWILGESSVLVVGALNVSLEHRVHSHRLSRGARIRLRTWRLVVGCSGTVEKLCSMQIVGVFPAHLAFRSQDRDHLQTGAARDGHRHKTPGDVEEEALRILARYRSVVQVDMVHGRRVVGLDAQDSHSSTAAEWVASYLSVFAKRCARDSLHRQSLLVSSFGLDNYC